jgi:hypothetical protein
LVLSSSIFGLAMSGGVAVAATDTKSVLEVVAIAEVDFGGILGTRSGAVAVGMTSDCKVLFTAQDALQFASGGASETAAKQKLAAMVKADGSPEGFHHGRWKQVDGPREGGLGAWNVSLSTLKDFVKTQVLLARKSVDVGGPGARSLPMNLHVQVRDIQHPPRPTPTRSSAVVSDPFDFVSVRTIKG